MSPRRKKLLKILLIAVVVMTSAVFFFSSSFFLTGAVLPAVRAFTGVELYIGSIDWRPWSGRLTVQNFRLGSSADTFLTIRKAHGYYDLRESLKGIISFSRLDATEVDLHFMLGEDGVWNFYKLAGQPAFNLAGFSGHYEQDSPELFLPAETDAPEEIPGAPQWLRFNLRDVTIRNSRLGLTAGNDKNRRHICWHDLNIGGDRFQNGAPMTMQAAGNIHFTSAQDLTLNTYGTLSSNVTWGETLMPDIMNLRFMLNSLSGNIGSKPMDGSTLTIALNSTYRDDTFHFSKLRIDQNKLTDQKSSLNAAGRWNTETDAFAFELQQAFLAPEPLALFFDLAFGINPGVMHFRGNGSMSYSHNDFSSTGHWTLDREQGPAIFGAERMELPGFKIDSRQDFSLQSSPRSINFRKLLLTLSENDSKNPAIQLSLRNPVKYRLDKESFDGSLPGIDLTVNKLNLRLLRLMFPDRDYLQFSSGALSGTAGLDFAGNTGDSALHGSFKLDGAAFPAGKMEITGLDAGLHLDSTIDPHGEIRLHRLNAALDYSGKKLADIYLSGRLSPEKQTAELNVRSDDIQLNNPIFGDSCRKLGFINAIPGLRTGISAKISTAPDSVKIQNFSILATGGEKSRFSAIFQPQYFSLLADSTTNAVNDWQCEVEADIPLKYFNGKDEVFQKGRLQLNSRINAPSDMESCTVNGSLQLHEAALKWGKIEGDSLSLNHDFSCYLPGNGEIRLNAGYTYLRIAGHPAMRSESRGVFSTINGDGELSFSLRYFNEQLVNLFLPGYFDILSGKGSAQFRRVQGSGHLTSQIAAGKIRRPGNKHVLSGDIQLELSSDKLQNSGTLTCSLEEQNTCCARFRLHGEEDRLSKKVKLSVISDFVDGSVFTALSAKAPEAPAEEKAVEKTPVRQAEASSAPEPLSPREIELELNMENLQFSPELQSAVHGRILLSPDRIGSQELVLFVNKVPVPVELQYSGDKGWHSRGTMQSPLDLAPVAKFFNSEYPVQGVLTNLNWDISAASMDKLLSGCGLQGELKGTMKDIAVENKAMHGPVMRIVMLPVEAVLRFNALIPGTADIRNHWRRLQETVLTGKNPLANIRFDSGDFELRAAGGKLEVSKMSFAGPVISKLDFSGSVALNKELPLALSSRMDMGGFAINMPITGDLEEPQINLSDLELALTGVRLDNLIDRMTYAAQNSKEPEKSPEPAPEKSPEPTPEKRPAPAPARPLWKRVILFWQD